MRRLRQYDVKQPTWYGGEKDRQLARVTWAKAHRSTDAIIDHYHYVRGSFPRKQEQRP